MTVKRFKTMVLMLRVCIMPVVRLSGNDLDKNAGQFVKTLQGSVGIGFADGFHVHKDWMAQTISFDDALDRAGQAESERTDYIAGINDIAFKVSDGGKFVVEIGGKQFRPTEHSFPQLSQKYGVLSSSILREMDSDEGSDRQDAETMVRIASNAIRRVKDDAKFFLRTYEDGTLRAVFTEKYAPINNRWYLETLKEFLPSARLSHWKSDEDTLWGNILIPDSMKRVAEDEDSDFGCMLSVANCEIGKRSINLLPSIFRSICLNGNIWGQKEGVGMKRKHMGKIDLGEFKAQIGEKITQQLPIAAAAIDKFLDTRRLAIKSNVRDVIAVIASDAKFSVGEAQRALRAHELLESHHESLFGVVNAITRMGQSYDPARQYDMDILGGQLAQMTADQWNRINDKSRSINTDDIIKIYGLAV
jgi:hypothetical protein